MKEDVRVEVEDTHIVIVFPSITDEFMTPWQDAYQLGTVLEMAAGDVPNPPKILNPVAINEEQAQILLNTYRRKFVVILLKHTDRIRLSPEAAKIVGRAIRQKAQDLDLLERKRIALLYNKRGLLQRLHDLKNGVTQIIPGR